MLAAGMNKNPKSLAAYYDLQVSPNSFDFSAYLIAAETYRRQPVLTDMQIIVVPPAQGPGHHDNTLFDRDHAHWRMHNIIIPLTQLMPSCNGLTICHSRDQAAAVQKNSEQIIFPENYTVAAPISRHHTAWTVIDAHLGYDIQYFEATRQAKSYARQWIDTHAGGRKCVAITLREAPFFEVRNSDLKVWGDFAHMLWDGGYYPVLLRDVDKALDALPTELEGIDAFTEGVFNLTLRLAFYEECELSAFVANGPGQVCFYDKNVQFIYMVTGDWLERKPTPFGRMAIHFGETPPFANQFQRWLWMPQDAGLLLDELCKLDRDIAAAKADNTFASKLGPIAKNRLPMRVVTGRFLEWADRAYGAIHEQTELAEACLDLLRPELGEDAYETETERFRLSKLLNIALGSKNLEKAKSILDVIGEKFGHTHQQVVQLGVVHEALGNLEAAISYYTKALEIEPSSTDLLYRLGKAYQESDDLIQATKHYEALVETGSAYPDLFAALGLSYEQMDMPTEALACYDLAEERGALNPDTMKRKMLLSGRI